METNTPNSEADCNPAWSEMARFAEERVRSQVQLMIAADQRATAFAGVCSSISAGSIAAAAGFSAVGSELLLVLGLVVMSLGALLAAGVAMFAANPAAILPTGIPPSDWPKFIMPPSVEQVHIAAGKIYFDHMNHNREVQNDKHAKIALSMTFLLISTVLFSILAILSLK